jgi:TonB-dependent receptor
MGASAQTPAATAAPSGTPAVLPPAAQAGTETGTIIGRVSDATTKLALPGARVSIPGTSLETFTNQQGDYALSNVAPGRMDVVVSFVGFETLTLHTQVEAGQTVRVDALFNNEVVTMSAYNVDAEVIGSARALNIERSAPALTDIVAADAIGQLPDKNVAEAMERIPGVDLYRDKGEGRFVEVRGIDPVYVGVDFNGIRASSTDKGTREVVLDVISSDMISDIEVNKVSTPDTDADDMGGSVNIKTRSGLDQSDMQAMVAAGTNFSHQEDRHGGYNLAGYYGNNLDNGKLGVFVGVVDEFRPFTVYNTEATGFWNPVLSPTDHNMDQMLSGQDFRHYDVQRWRHAIDASLDYKFSDTSKIFFRYTMSYYTERDNYWVTEFNYASYSSLLALTPTSATIVEPAKDLLKEGVGVVNSKISTSVVGGYEKKFDSFTDDLTVGYTLGKYTRPTMTLAEANTSAMTVNYSFTDPWHDIVSQTAGNNFNDPAQYAFSTKSQFTNTMAGTHEKTAKDDLKKDFEIAGMPAFVKIGGEFRDKDNFQQDMKVGITSLPFTINSELYPNLDTQYNWGGFESFRILPQANQAFYSLQQSIPVTNKPDTGSYMSTEKIDAGYAMGGLTAGKLKILAGVRLEATDFWIEGQQEDVTTSVFSNVIYTHNYGNVLPDVVLTYEFDPRTILRASWTNSIARPDYSVTIPGRSVDDVAHLVTQGNPEIDPLKSINWDASITHYYGKLGAVSAAVYYKSIENFAYQAVSGIDPATGYQLNTYLTAPTAWMYGAELSWRQRFDFLPSPFDGLGINANATFDQSQVTYPTRPGETLPFVGLAHEVSNIALTYERNGLKMHFAVNHHSPRMQVDSALGANSTQDLYEDAFTQYDFGGSFAFMRHWQAYFNASDIFNAKLREYYGGTAFKRLSQFENYGTGFETGLRWTY